MGCKVIVRLAVTTLFLLVLLTLPAVVYAAPQVSGYISGPRNVAYGNSFSISITIKNSGDKTAYLCNLVLGVPAGFSVSKTNIFIGDLDPGKSKTYSVSVTAPKYTTTGTFTATVFYSNNPGGKGTSLAGYIFPLTVQVKRGNLITFMLVSTSGILKSATISVYDSSGKYVAGGAGIASSSTSGVMIQVYLLNGKYMVAAAGKVDTQRGERNAFGQANFYADKDKSILMNLKPIP